MDKVSTSLVVLAQKQWVRDRRAERTIGDRIGLLRMVYRDAKLMGQTTETPFDNPMPARKTARARRDRGSKRVSFRPYTSEELAAILETLGQPRNELERRWYPLTEAMVLTGLRYGEPAALRWPDVHRPTNTLLWRRGRATSGPTPIDKPTKTGAEWRITMTTRLADLIQRQREATYLTGGGWVFPTSVGTPMLYSNWNRRVWQPLVKRAEVERRPGEAQKSLRRSYISSSHVCGRTPKLLASELGHPSVRMVTEQYDSFLDPANWPAPEERIALRDIYGCTDCPPIELKESRAEND